MEPEDSLPNRFTLQSSVKISSGLSDFDFLPYKLWKTPGLVLCRTDGKIQIYSPNGDLFKEFDSGHSILSCASVYSPEELIIGSIDSTYLRVHSIQYNITANYPVTLIVDSLMFNNTSAVPTAFTQYSRLGKKLWVVGDSLGEISVFFQDGELQGRANGKVGPISHIDRYGQSLIYSGKRKIAVFNTGNLEVGTVCEDTIADINAISLDIQPAIVFAALDNGDIMVYDTRFSVSNGPASCKAVYRLVAKNTGNLASVKGHLLVWGDGVLTAFNTSFLETEANSMGQSYSLPVKTSQNIKSYKNNKFNSVFLASHDEIRIYEVAIPVGSIPTSSSSSFDFGYLRIILIILAVIFIVFWKTKGRKSKRELEVEKLEESLEELQKSMESTSKISEDLTSRFKNVEASTKHLSSLTGLDNSDSD